MRMLNCDPFVASIRTALMLACESDSAETVAVLLRGGANTQLVDGLGNKADDYSPDSQHIVHMLQNGAPPGTVLVSKSFP